MDRLPVEQAKQQRLAPMSETLQHGNTILYLCEPLETQVTGYTLAEWRSLAAALSQFPLKEWHEDMRLSWAFVSMYRGTWQQETAGLDVGSRSLGWFRGAWREGVVDSRTSWALQLAVKLGLSGQEPSEDHLTSQETGMRKILQHLQDLKAQSATQQEQLKAQSATQQEQLMPLLKLFDYMLVDRFRFSSGKTERGDNRPFKLTLYNYYGQPKVEADTYPENLQCALSGITLPATSIIAAHLWKHEWADSIDMLFSFSDIDDPRNGLLLYKLFEEAYDRHQICFVYYPNEAVATWRCHVLDKDILRLTWKEYLKPAKNQSEGTKGEAVTRAMDEVNKQGLKCFEDIDGRALHLSALRQPFKRVLNLHARLGLLRARKENKLPDPTWDFDDFHSDAIYASKNTLQKWAAGVGSGVPSEDAGPLQMVE